MNQLPISKKRSLRLQQGQALLVVLLSVAVILTVALSIVSRSISDVAVTTYEEEALRAFSAAEAGIEKALLDPIPCAESGTCEVGVNPDPQDTTVSYTTIVDNPSQGNSFKYPSNLVSGDSATFWFVDHDSSGMLTCASGECTRALAINICAGPGGPLGIEVLVFYDSEEKLAVSSPNNFLNVRVYRRTFGDIDNAESFNLSQPQCNNLLGVQSGTRQARIQVSDICSNCVNNPGRLLLVKVKIYYYNSPSGLPVGVYTDGAFGLPPQGVKISSTGVAGDSTREIEVFQSYHEDPTLFDNAVFSGAGLVK